MIYINTQMDKNTGNFIGDDIHYNSPWTLIVYDSFFGKPQLWVAHKFFINSTFVPLWLDLEAL